MIVSRSVFSGARVYIGAGPDVLCVPQARTNHRKHAGFDVNQYGPVVYNPASGLIRAGPGAA